jgi:glycosyltransferase involved in cell wall biosynthesis
MQDGARIATINLLKGLTSIGVTIDVVAVAGQEEHCDTAALQRVCGVSDCYVFRRGDTGSQLSLRRAFQVAAALLLHPWLAVTLAPYAAAPNRHEIKKLIGTGPGKSGRWTALVYDGLHPAAHAATFGRYRKPTNIPHVIYRAHNVETEIWNRKATLTRFWPLRFFFQTQARLMERFEKSLVRAAAAVLTVSSVDLELFRKMLPSLRGSVAPIGYDFSHKPQAPETADTVLFLGRLDWPPNQDGLSWLLDQVWPEVHKRRPLLKLLIAGSGNSDWLKARLPISGVEFLGRVDSVDTLYGTSAISLVPVFYGSGTRVKAIEASRYGRACLSTAVGIEGLGLEPGKTYLHAETASDWIAALTEFHSDTVNKVGLQAYESLKSAFHLPIAAAKFIEPLTALNSDPEEGLRR